MPRRISFFVTIFLLCALLGGGIRASHAWADSHLAVLYPEAREPYRTVFRTILKGIESNHSKPIAPYPLPEDFKGQELNRWLSKEQPDSIIVLGKKGFMTALKLDGDRPVVAGSVLIPPDSIPGVSLAADPERLFRELKSLVPKAKRIFTVYNPRVNEWLVQRAEKAAQSHGLQLISYKAKDLREAITAYRELIDKQLQGHDAIWLPHDSISSNDKVVLPMLLKEAWTKKFILFSSRPGHAKKGALFSFSPDFYALGQRLATIASDSASGKKKPELIPMQDLNMAVNMRTAAHLGLNFSSRQQESFDLRFP